MQEVPKHAHLMPETYTSFGNQFIINATYLITNYGLHDIILHISSKFVFVSKSARFSGTGIHPTLIIPAAWASLSTLAMIADCIMLFLSADDSTLAFVTTCYDHKTYLRSAGVLGLKTFSSYTSKPQPFQQLSSMQQVVNQKSMSPL